MKLLVDMNLSPRWIELFTDAGMDAVHWSSVGRANAPDSEIMSYAEANGCVVLTQDLDFSAILAVTHGNKPSVIQIRSEDLDLAKIGKQVVAAIVQMNAELDQGALLTIDPKRTRLRILPLPSKS